MKRALSLSIVAAALLCAPAARAQGADLAAAQALFDEAKQLVAQGKLAEACPKFLASFQADPKPGTAVNLADCFEKNGQTASAWARYLEAASLAQRSGQAEREQYAKERAAALEPRLLRLSISAPAPAPSGLEVLRDGVPVNLAALGSAVPVDPGKHLIEARAPGKKPWSKTVEIGLGTPRTAVQIPPLEDGAGGAPAPAPGAVAPPGGTAAPGETPAPPAGSFWTTKRVAGAAIGGVGLAGIVVGSALGAVNLKQISDAKSQGHCNAALTICDSPGLQALQGAKTTAHASTASFVVGGAALVTGVVLIATGGAPSRSATGLSWSLGAVAGAGMTGPLVRGAW